MGKTYYFLGFGLFFFLMLSFVKNNSSGTAVKKADPGQTPSPYQEVAEQLGFIAQFSLTALQKIDNPGILDLTEELDSTYFELFTIFRSSAAKAGYEVQYTPAAEHKMRLQRLKGIRLEEFETTYLPLLIEELERLQKINAGIVNEVQDWTNLQTEIQKTTQRFLDISKVLLQYQEHLS